jgi:hypothetical protein
LNEPPGKVPETAGALDPAPFSGAGSFVSYIRLFHCGAGYIGLLVAHFAGPTTAYC